MRPLPSRASMHSKKNCVLRACATRGIATRRITPLPTKTHKARGASRSRNTTPCGRNALGIALCDSSGASSPEGDAASVLCLGLVVLVGVAGVSEAGADGQHGPALHVLHEGQLAQSLNDRVVVHQYDGGV